MIKQIPEGYYNSEEDYQKVITRYNEYLEKYERKHPQQVRTEKETLLYPSPKDIELRLMWSKELSTMWTETGFPYYITRKIRKGEKYKNYQVGDCIKIIRDGLAIITEIETSDDGDKTYFVKNFVGSSMNGYENGIRYYKIAFKEELKSAQDNIDCYLKNKEKL
jgi:hypothetical protein